MLIEDIRKAIDGCLQEWDCLNAYYIIFGIYDEDIPEHLQIGDWLLQQKRDYTEKLDSVESLSMNVEDLNNDATIQGIFIRFHLLRLTRKSWEEGAVTVLCSQQLLKELALNIKQDGSVFMYKSELKKLLDLSKAIPFWNEIPNYTTISLGGGIGFSSPEFDAFSAMGWSYNEAKRTRTELEKLHQKIKLLDFEFSDIELMRDTKSHHFRLCRQTILNSFLLLEAYLNSMVHLYLCNPLKHLTEDEKLFLMEKAKDERGIERQRFVSVQLKLTEWVKIISPRSETFDKGKNPFQDFMKIKDFRDAIVHFGEGKVNVYNSIDFDTAEKAVFVVISIIEEICQFTASDKNNVKYPFWLKSLNHEGLFELGTKIEIHVPTT